MTDSQGITLSAEQVAEALLQSQQVDIQNNRPVSCHNTANKTTAYLSQKPP